MSRVLDQIVMEDVARNCPKPFLDYQNCMQSPEVKDKRECIKYQTALQKCVQEEVPTFQTIQTKCGAVISKYEACLRKNRTNYSSECFNELKALRVCASGQVGGDTQLEKNRKKAEKPAK